MAEAEEEVDVGGPRPDALHRGEAGMGLLGGKRGELVEGEAAGDGFG